MSGELKENATPREVFLGFIKAVEERNGEASWNMLSKATQELFGAMFALMNGFANAFTDTAKEITGATEPEGGSEPFSGMTDGKSMWVDLITEGKDEGNPMKNLKDVSIKSEEVGETESHLMLVGKDGKEDKVDLVKEDGAWKLVLAGLEENQ